MDKKLMYTVGFVLVVTWGLPTIFTTILLWFLISQYSHTDLIIAIVDGYLSPLFKTESLLPPPTTDTSLLIPHCQGQFKNGSPCCFKPVQNGYCRRHVPLSLRS